MPKLITEDTIVGEIHKEWLVSEYDQHERSPAWYVLMISVGLSLVIYGMVTGNFVFSLIVILVAIIMYLQSHQEPLQIPILITDSGLIVGNKIYSYSELEDFYVVYNPPEVQTLFITPKSALRPIVRVPLMGIDPMEIKSALRPYLFEDEEKESEPLTDSFARRWKIH